MKLTISLLVPLAFAFFSTSGSCAYTKEEGRKPNIKKTISILGIRTQKPKPGFYGVEGFVTGHFSCPPCPAQSGCEPCRRGNSVVVSPENKRLDSDNLSDKEILLHTDNPESFEHGKKYRFEVEITDETLHNDPGLSFIKIIDQTPIS